MVNVLKSISNFCYGTKLAVFLLLSFAHPVWAGDWALRDKNGMEFTLSGLHGRWVLVNFWAPWCPPCLREIPDLVALQQKHKDLQVIGVAVMYGSRKEVMDTVDKQLGAIARPRAVHFVTLLPKTRSGKTLRRSIQALAEGRDPGDLTTIEDPNALEQIRKALQP